MKRLILLLAAVGTALAARSEPPQPPRWIKADDLRVRAAPGLDHPVVGVLQRGSQVTLKNVKDFDGFCLVEGDGQYGHVACQYLSTEPVSRPRAGRDGVPQDRRWIAGTAVILRTAPTRDAAQAARLAINRTVQLLQGDAGSGYCEIQPLDRAGSPEGPSGYTACQYLGLEPLPVAEVAGVDGDPVRAFWRAPHWWRLEAYAQALAKSRSDAGKTDPLPRNEALEQMKSHLALGLKGAPPRPLPDWAALKAMAAAHDPSLLNPATRERAWSGKDKDLWRREIQASQAAHAIQTALGLHGPLHDSISAEGGAQRVLHLMRSLELPSAQPSLFRSESEVGPPGERAEQLAGRFGGIYRTIVSPRKTPPRDGDGGPGAGLYDMHSRTEALTRPVQHVRLDRDGTLRSAPSHGRFTEVLWREVDEPQCEGWSPGFAYGDVQGPIWRHVDETARGPAAKALPASAPLLLFAYHAMQEPPRAKALSSGEQTINLDRAATGFARFTQLGFDLDGDARTDLIVLEGVGPGPGHLNGPTTSDDPWYRLLLVNIAGTWKVLASDSFSYGCGC